MNPLVSEPLAPHAVHGNALLALRTQIEPHFLFNALATVRAWHSVDSLRSRWLLRQLIDHLCESMGCAHLDEVPLARELALVRAYLCLAQARMGKRLRYSIDVPAPLMATPVPTLALATLVENAVKHGVAPSLQGGRVEVRARVAGEVLMLEVGDDGVGLQVEPGQGLGLANVRERLRLLHGDEGRLSIAARRPHGVRACLRWPLRRRGAQVAA